MGSLWNRSGVVERYADDLRASGAKAYFFSGGTTTPLTVFQDSGEAAAHPHPVVADADGRWPDVFVPYIVSYDVQVKTAAGVQLTYSLQIPNPDPVELTVTIPAESQIQTGMIHGEMVNATKAGYVRLNGRTLGNADSGGSERANADTEDLFSYLWNNLTDAIAAVSGGRGGSAAADYAANKSITLPNWQGAGPIGLDDMGSSAGGFFSGLTFSSGNATTAGSLTGSNGVTLSVGNLPAHSHSGTTGTEGAHTHTGTTDTESVSHTHTGTTSSDGDHSHGGATSSDGVKSNAAIQNAAAFTAGSSAGLQVGGSLGVNTADNHTHTISASGTHSHTMTTGTASVPHTHSFTTAAGSAHSHTFTTDSQGSSTPFNNLGRSILVTWFIKL